MKLHSAIALAVFLGLGHGALKAMRRPGLTIEQVFKQVRLNVLRLSGERQNTWDSSNITGEFYFKF